MMQCARFQDEMAALLDGADAGTSREPLSTHRDSCPACAAAFEDLRRTLADLRALPTPEPAFDFEDRVLARVRAERGRGAISEPNPARAPRRFRPSRLAAAVLLPLLGAGVLAAVLLTPTGTGGGADAAVAEARARVRKLAAVGGDFLRQVEHLDDEKLARGELLNGELIVSGLAPLVAEARGVLARADAGQLAQEQQFCQRMGEFVARITAQIESASDAGDPTRIVRQVAADLGLPALCATMRIGGSGGADLPCLPVVVWHAETVPAVPGRPGDALHDFLAAKRAWYGGRVREARGLFEQFVERHPGDALADDAFYFTVRAAAADDERLPLPGPATAVLLARAEPWFEDQDAEPERQILLSHVAEWRAELPDIIPLISGTMPCASPATRMQIRLQRGGHAAVLVDDPELTRTLDDLRRTWPAIEVRRRGPLTCRVVLPAELKSRPDAMTSLVPFLTAYPSLFVFRAEK